MMHTLRLRAISVFIFCLAPVAISHAGDIEIKNGWARATPPGAVSGAVYMSIENKGTTDETLLTVKTASAEHVGIHAVTMKDGMVGMKHLSSLKIRAGESVELKPGSYHLMMTGLKHSLKEGDELEIKLLFEHAGEMKVVVPVKMFG